MASWATRTPAIRDILSVSIAEMGGVLFGLSIGSMSGILCSAWLVKRFGTRNVILVTMSCALIGMMILSLALWLTSPLLFAVGLGVFGASFGSAEVAINVEGAAVEREMNKTVLNVVFPLLILTWSMTVNSSRNALKRRTWALFMFFFLPGLLMASWATRTPAIRDILSVSIAEMGGVLFGLSIGSMSGILCSAWLVKRFGTRNVILVTMSCALIGMMILSLALWLTSPLLFAVGLGVFGASFGSAEVAINVEGAAVEREMNKTVLPMMHGFYSLGTLAGAGVGMALTAFGVPATVHILLAALVGIAPIYIAIQAIPDGTGKNAADGTQHGEKGVPFYRDIQLLLIGVVVLAMAFAEGSANDWLPLLMVDGHGFSPTSGSLIYAGFTLGMTVGRFTGGWFIDRYSRVAVVRASALMGALGIGLIIFVDSAWVCRGSGQCTNGGVGYWADYFCR